MATTINDQTMTSGETPHFAIKMQSEQPDKCWYVSWLPNQPLDRNQAITAMLIAETAAEIVGSGQLDKHPMWPHFNNWSAELSLTGTEAFTRAVTPPAETAARQIATLAALDENEADHG